MLKIQNIISKRTSSMGYKFFDQNSAGYGITTLADKSTFNNEIKQNLHLAEELHKPLIKKF